ncbi:hypothetical protein KEM48_004421 [Puccinia striiformis f. sp. tritici PST-130]|nr:hypothetical protein KEM48_004421 [Puccinia striiformis f. sp. tritici PST-130]
MTRSKVLCTCVSQGCLSHNYLEEGIVKHGQYVSAATRQTHRMFEERNRIIVGLASGKLSNTPSLPVGITPPPPADKALPEAFLSLSIEDVHQLLPHGFNSNLHYYSTILLGYYQ